MNDGDLRRPQIIRWDRIAAAEAYYADAGFEPLAVPWVVDRAVLDVTLPPGCEPYTTRGGTLVGSGEQSFLALLLDGETFGAAQCVTPCFRDEHLDTWHDPYFLKLELIRVDDTSDEALGELISSAARFFDQHLPVDVISLDDGTFDICCAATGVELGSYGRRHGGGLTWLYGTGLAEPRLERVLRHLRPH